MFCNVPPLLEHVLRDVYSNGTDTFKNTSRVWQIENIFTRSGIHSYIRVTWSNVELMIRLGQNLIRFLIFNPFSTIRLKNKNLRLYKHIFFFISSDSQITEKLSLLFETLVFSRL